MALNELLQNEEFAHDAMFDEGELSPDADDGDEDVDMGNEDDDEE